MTDHEAALLEDITRSLCHDIDRLERMHGTDAIKIILDQMLPKTMHALRRWTGESEALTWHYSEQDVHEHAGREGIVTDE